MGLKLPLRMTIIRLKNGDLLLHSPTPFSPEVAKAVEGLGRVRHLVAPNIAHWTFLADWQRILLGNAPVEFLLEVFMRTSLIYLMLIQPAWRTLDRHAQELPGLRAQAARVDALVQESLALGGQRNARIAPQALQNELAASLTRAALGGAYTVTALEEPDAHRWQIALTEVTAAALFDWMGNAPSQLRLTLTQVDLTRAVGTSGKALPGKASGTLVLTGVAP
ncbi:MAG: DUF4336 domain-containing protein, partial [Comamonadaceae bacterium]